MHFTSEAEVPSIGVSIRMRPMPGFVDCPPAFEKSSPFIMETIVKPARLLRAPSHHRATSFATPSYPQIVVFLFSFFQHGIESRFRNSSGCPLMPSDRSRSSDELVNAFACLSANVPPRVQGGLPWLICTVAVFQSDAGLSYAEVLRRTWNDFSSASEKMDASHRERRQ